jgi:hypothetical protein
MANGAIFHHREAGEKREGEDIISADAKKSYGSTMVLMVLGLLALYGGARWLLALIPVALVVWYAAGGAMFRTNRN